MWKKRLKQKQKKKKPPAASAFPYIDTKEPDFFGDFSPEEREKLRASIKSVNDFLDGDTPWEDPNDAVVTGCCEENQQYGNCGCGYDRDSGDPECITFGGEQAEPYPIPGLFCENCHENVSDEKAQQCLYSGHEGFLDRNRKAGLRIIDHSELDDLRRSYDDILTNFDKFYGNVVDALDWVHDRHAGEGGGIVVGKLVHVSDCKNQLCRRLEKVFEQ